MGVGYKASEGNIQGCGVGMPQGRFFLALISPNRQEPQTGPS